MGAWDIGIFDCDEALDFSAKLQEGRDLSLVHATFHDNVKCEVSPIPVDLCHRVLVCAEVTAVIFDRDPRLPDDLGHWASQFKIGKEPKDEELRVYAQDGTLRVLRESELRDLWEESESFEQWKTLLKDLARRLGAYYKPKKSIPNAKKRRGKKVVGYVASVVNMINFTLSSKDHLSRKLSREVDCKWHRGEESR
ncbi:MAG: DUF4259 domain-containing protein [Blastochloris sp.]|nr:DUF4259 domain-containing protein [Blastochloris sp.]